MSVAKVIEITASSPESFEGAIKEGIKRATSSVEQICGAWIKEQKVVVNDGAIKEYRVDMMVTFVMK